MRIGSIMDLFMPFHFILLGSPYYFLQSCQIMSGHSLTWSEKICNDCMFPEYMKICSRSVRLPSDFNRCFFIHNSDAREERLWHSFSLRAAVKGHCLSLTFEKKMMDCRPKHVFPEEIGNWLKMRQMYFKKILLYASAASLIWLSAG